jgi:hypothetical protein
MGKFALLKKLYAWNEKATGNKFIDNLLFWILNIIPVYGIVTFVDVVILNLVEFWTGSNPMAMAPGERIEKWFSNGKGAEFLAIATQNQMEIKFKGQPEKDFTLRFDPSSKAWMLDGKEKTICLARELENGQVALNQPVGENLIVSKEFNAKDFLGLRLSSIFALAK